MRLHFEWPLFQWPTVARILALTMFSLVGGADLTAEPVAVRYVEGVAHGFLVLKDQEGSIIADGDLIQAARGSRVTARLTFRFRDGSVHDETTVFSQGGHFRLISDHLVQRGPSFPQPLDVSIDASGRVTVQYTAEDGTAKEKTEHLELPDDLSNGVIPTLLKNADPKSPPASFSFLVATPKPQVVKLEVSTAAAEHFRTGRENRTATHYVLKVNLGGLRGLFASLLGKQPPDSHVWILEGDAPAFVRSEQPFYAGGPVWQIELTAPVWPAGNTSATRPDIDSR